MTKFVIAITGPAGSGKSTVSKIIAKQINQCVNIDADLVKHMVVNGFIFDYSTAALSQWELLGENIGMLAKNFQQAGYNVIINGYIHESSWKNIMKHVELTHKYVLLPDLDKIKERDKLRQEEFIMGDEAVTMHHEYFSKAAFYKDFIKINSTPQTVDETVKEITAKISR